MLRGGCARGYYVFSPDRMCLGQFQIPHETTCVILDACFS